MFIIFHKRPSSTVFIVKYSCQYATETDNMEIFKKLDKMES